VKSTHLRHEFFTPEIRLDVNYLQDFNHPVDHTIVGSTEEFRSGEFQIEQVSLGGTPLEQRARRFLSMFGLFAVTTPRNDASSGVGQWDLQGAYKYFFRSQCRLSLGREPRLNVDAGVFVSYIGLFSYYNLTTGPISRPSSHRTHLVTSTDCGLQWFPTQTLKIEPWLINGCSPTRSSTAIRASAVRSCGSERLVQAGLQHLQYRQDNLATGSGIPNNGGNPSAAIGAPNPNAH